MVSLSTSYADLALKNPIIIAGGPWSRNGAAIQRSIDAGAGAVVTETITMDVRRNPSPRLFGDRYPDHIFNTTLYSDIHLEQWEREFSSLRRGDCKLIASIWGGSPSELSYLASRVARMGADAIEVSISAPIGTRDEALNNYPLAIRDYLQAAVEAVQIPVFAKLSYEAANSRVFTDPLVRSGISGLTAIDSLKGLNGVDLEQRRVPMTTYGGYGGPPIKPVSLATMTTLKQVTKLPLCGCGGIYSAEDALEFIMLGACCVQLASGILRKGYALIPQVLADLERWLEGHGCDSIQDIQGQALPSLRPFEDILPRPLAARLTGSCDGCGWCVDSCLYQALRGGEGTVELLSERCAGCGMCVSVCPRNALELGW